MRKKPRLDKEHLSAAGGTAAYGGSSSRIRREYDAAMEALNFHVGRCKQCKDGDDFCTDGQRLEAVADTAAEALNEVEPLL